jgi:putative FmdB family regulatory protein
MPVYEFRCQSCGKVFAIEAHLNDRERLAVCPECGSRKVAPVFSSFAVSRAAKLIPTKP